MRADSKRRRLHLHVSALAVGLAVATWASPSALARCVDESAQESNEPPADPGVPQPNPRATLQTLVRDAIDRSHQVGAQRLLAEAAQDDVQETRAGKGIVVSAGAGLSSDGSRTRYPAQGDTPPRSVNDTSAAAARASLSISQLLYDGGRVDRLTDWRTQLAESARHGHLSAQEQVALNTVSLALERSRFRQHVVVYGQYVRKMACLVEALETIVRADRGRASELIQARKNLQQAEISLTQAQSQARQVDVRLRRLVGDGLPSAAGLNSVLLTVPDLNQLVADVERSTEIEGLTAQAAALNNFARAAEAAGRPQLSWNISGSGNAVQGGTKDGTRSGTYGVGVTLNIPLVDPRIQPATDAARKRARAAELQREEALQARRFRVAEVHEQTNASFDRARRVGAVLRDSEQVRNFTLQQWQQLGRRSLFDVMGAEAEHYNLRINYVNAIVDGQQLHANLLSLGRGVNEWLR
jgi:outer membrane protein, adhesin transport system